MGTCCPVPDQRALWNNGRALLTWRGPPVCRGASEEELAAVVRAVDEAEARGDIGPWAEGDVPTSIIPPGSEPPPGEIAERRELPALGATLLTLGNGMKVWGAGDMHVSGTAHGVMCLLSQVCLREEQPLCCKDSLLRDLGEVAWTWLLR